MLMLKRMPSDPPPQRASLGAQMRVDAGRCGHKAAYRQLTGSVLAFYWELIGSVCVLAGRNLPTMAIGRDTSKVP